MSSGICEKCGKELTPISMEIKRYHSGGGIKPEMWCINCVREELHKNA
jgi:hypothetical protein